MGSEHQRNRDRSNFGAILHPLVVVIIVKESLTESHQANELDRVGCTARAMRVDNAAAKLRQPAGSG